MFNVDDKIPDKSIVIGMNNQILYYVFT